MRSSRSKRTELNVLADSNQSPPRTADATQLKAHGSGFSSFFSRSKANKAQTPLLKNGSPETPGIDVDLMSQKATRRNSLATRHYRAMSRSMNDLGGLISRTDVGVTGVANAMIARVSETSASRIPVVASSGRSPIKGQSALGAEPLPFPINTITKQGWLNKRGSKKEASLKLHRVFVCSSLNL